MVRYKSVLTVGGYVYGCVAGLGSDEEEEEETEEGEEA